MRVAILGTGALGCVFAAQLAEQVEVWMLGTWSEGLAAVQRDGITVQEPEGTCRQVRVATASDPALVPPADAALILVKSYQTERAAAWAARVLSRTGGLAVTLQNGLDNGQKIAAAVGPARAAIGVTYLGATLLGPGRVRLAARQRTCIGLNGTADHLIESFVSVLNRAGLEAHTTPDAEALLWGKAIANAAINPLTALWRVLNGELLATPERRKLLAALAREGATVAQGKGIALPFDDPVEYVISVCRATAANRSSMLQDVGRGRSTEVDSINGAIVAEGVKLGIPAPLNEMVWHLVRGIAACAA